GWRSQAGNQTKYVGEGNEKSDGTDDRNELVAVVSDVFLELAFQEFDSQLHGLLKLSRILNGQAGPDDQRQNHQDEDNQSAHDHLHGNHILALRDMNAKNRQNGR